eukprot:INCI5858.2.p1 GENE.INCI5858.2~~INCI5858.2.p1  ORF type:complete len:144 (-),score=15.51 INCI5858.2:24-455(-)
MVKAGLTVALLAVGATHASELVNEGRPTPALCHQAYNTYECENGLGVEALEFGRCAFFNNGRRIVSPHNDTHILFSLYHGSTCIGKPQSTLEVPLDQCLTDDFELYCSTVNVFACTYGLNGTKGNLCEATPTAKLTHMAPKEN